MDTFSDAPPSNAHRGIRLIPFFAVILLCLAAGLVLGSLAGGGLEISPRTPEPPAVFILLGYDTLRNPTKVDFLWVLTLDGAGHARYQGVSPATVFLSADGQAAVIREMLSDPAGAPARMYQIPLLPQPSITVEIDRQGLMTVINRMGGVRLDSGILRGQEVIDLLAAAIDPLDSLRLQARIIKGLFGTAGPCPDASALSGLHPEHILSAYPPDLLVSECTRRGPYFAGAVEVTVLDNVLSMVLPDGSVGLLLKEQ